MMFAQNRIRNLFEPNVLTLAWNIRGKKRFTVGELERKDDYATLRYFPNSDEYIEATEMGFEPIIGFNDPHKEYSDGVLEYFMSRITSRERDDFDLYLKTIGINPINAEDVSDFALLGYGEGRLPSDGFQVINSYEDVIPPIQFVTEVSATVHCPIDDDLEFSDGDKIELLCESDNPVDKFAISVNIKNTKIGYINRIQAETICNWLAQGFTTDCVLYRKNGRPSAPRYFVFVSVS